MEIEINGKKIQVSQELIDSLTAKGINITPETIAIAQLIINK